MSKGKHTPRPWNFTLTFRLSGVPSGFSIHSDTLTVIVNAEPAAAMPLEEMLANAQLITAVPELLESCEALLQCLEAHLDEQSRALNVTGGELCPCSEQEIPKARAAIAKAKGND